MKPGPVICLGAAVVDHVFDVAEIPSQPIKISAASRMTRCGGPAATAAVAIRALGRDAAMWARIGRDSEGDFVRVTLAGHGVDTAEMIETDARTIVAIVVVDGMGERLIIGHGAADLPPATDALPLSRIAGAGAVVADSSWPEAALVAFEVARAHGVPTILDGEEYNADKLIPLARSASLPVFSEGAATLLCGGASPNNDSLANLGALIGGDFGLTRGKAGSLWRIGGETIDIPALDVVSRDTTGAGDVFHGALAAASADRMPLLTAARFATACAGLKCQFGMGWDGMPSRDAVEAALSRL